MTTRLREGEGGFALITVIGITAILTLIAVVALNYARNSLPQARQHQDWNAALSAAEAGVDDFLARLNRDQFYWQTADPAGNPALDGWGTAPDSGLARFHYTFDGAETASTGQVRLVSVGSVNGVQRTIETRLARDSFLRYLYFTQWETRPEFDIATESADGCDAAFGERDAGCTDIFFISEDVIDGPLHTNDQLALDGSPTFVGEVTSGFGGEDTWRGSLSVDTDDVFLDNDPSEPLRRDPLQMPRSNRELADYSTDLAGGCLYYGPTFIELGSGDNLGKMRVSSPLSHLPPDGSEATSSACRGNASLTGVEDTGWIDLPENGVIYVADHDPDVHGATPHPLDLPRSGQAVASFSVAPAVDGGAPGSEQQFLPWRGDVFVWGSFDEPLTIGAQADLYPVWDLLATNDEAMLGLIANRYVRLWHPVNTSGANLSVIGHPPFPSWSTPTARPGGVTTWRDARIDAAIFAVRRSFVVDQYAEGSPLGTLTVNGAIAQRFRGPVGTFFVGGSVASGYDKDYSYDNRLLYISPPFFISPVSSSFGVVSWAEIRTPDAVPALD